jgi:aspartate kinase
MDFRTDVHTIVQTIVQKYGGATLSDPARIKKAAAHIQSEWTHGHKLVIVVSAMGKTTNDLISLAQQVAQNPSRREMDMLLTAGERIAMSLLTMALQDLGVPAVSFTGSQAGILTNEAHSAADIIDVKAPRVVEALEEGKVVVLAGFQGVSPKTKEITTLGRGGSDLTAVAMAAALGADRCDILKDVAGVYSADPNEIDDALILPELTFEEFAEMTFCGSQVLQNRAVQYASQHKVSVWIGSADTQSDRPMVLHTKSKIIPERYKVAPELLAVSSHPKLVALECAAGAQADLVLQFCAAENLVAPAIFFSQEHPDKVIFYCAGPKEVLQAFERRLSEVKPQGIAIKPTALSSISLQASGPGKSATPEPGMQVHAQKAAGLLKALGIEVYAERSGFYSHSFFVASQDRLKALRILHSLVAAAFHTAGF